MENTKGNNIDETLQNLVLSIVIVNYKSWKDLENCLNSLIAMKCLSFELDIIVVDNDMDSEERRRFIKTYHSISFYGNTGNNGFANACNFGANKANGDYYLFLNPDTIASPEAIKKMLEVAVKHVEYGIVSCQQVNEKGSKEKQIRFFPDLKTLFGAFRVLYRSRNKKQIDSKFKLDQRIIFPDWVSGSVMLMSKGWFDRLDGFNEDYWMYFEDVDLCKRVSLQGGKIALLRDVKIIHNHGGASRINIKTSALTRSQVLISKHIYVCNYFRGNKRSLLQILLILYVLIFKFLGGVLGLVLFFIPKMYLRCFIYINMLRYYFQSLKNGTWLSPKSVHHFSRRAIEVNEKSKIQIGYDAKRIYHNRTGLGNYSRDLVSILSNFYSSNKYLLYNPKKKKIDRLSKSNNLIEILPKSNFWRKNSSIWRQGPIVNQLVEDGVSIFHGLSGEIPRGLKTANIRSVVTIHDLIFIRYPNMYKYMDRKIHFRKFLFAAENADLVIAISEQTKRDVIEFLKIKEDKIRVVYQGCHELFKKNQSDSFKRIVAEKFKLPKKFLLSVGTIEERKNLLLAVKAVKDLDEVLVVVGGKTKYYDTIRKYIIENDIQNKVLFLESVELKELVALYQIAELFLYPSLFEGFGIPIIEALYSKTPVITSKGSCFSEAGGPDSIYVSPTDDKELKVKIEEVLSNDSLKKNMIDRGYEFVQKFNDANIAENVMNVYRELL